MDYEVFLMDGEKMQKLFGVGPTGAGISCVLLAFLAWIDYLVGHPAVMGNAIPMKTAGSLLVVIGLGLHFWTFFTLRNWWKNNRLCTQGPFKFFRHPMYAAWITFICSGVILYLNSWILLFLPLLLHPIWHRLVKKEEKVMLENFGNEYLEYAEQTGRFIPRILNGKYRRF